MINIGSWTTPLEPGKQPSASILNSNRHEARAPLEYSDEDIKHIEKWGTYQTWELVTSLIMVSNSGCSFPSR
jgi:alcohol oxidase